MKKGKSFFENENLVIYVGTAIFFILSISIGIIIYMVNSTNSQINVGKIEQENKVEVQEDKKIEETESASSNIGKTVEEQENLNNNNKPEEDKKTNENTNKPQNTNKEENTQITNSQVEENKPEEKVTEVKKEITFTKPAEGEILCEYAKDNLIYSETLKEWITHTAIDIKADKTSVIKSSADGIVKSILNDPRYGLTIIISHDDGYETVYANLLTAEFVVEGENVKQGQTVGTAGNTASFESNMDSHLHFEIIKNGEYLDPSIYIK